MSAKTSIEWTDRTWNPVRGCTKVSAGCDNCYAMAVAHRFSGPGKPYAGLTRVIGGRGQWNGEVRTLPDALLAPLRWRTPARIFVNSMSDLFHEGMLPALDQVIIGGESGPGARPFDIEWARAVIAQRSVLPVSIFVKQLGAVPVCHANGDIANPVEPFGLLYDKRKGGDMDDWPPDLRVREFPRPR